ncbi:MAG: hypothetical protein IAX21_05455 [Candidatus Bathyarchaeota archaeon]|nr:hypothetical protein [Candidatus Bathyarchaeum tardum]WGM89607.1 MAG: hypothetical protein NUK63_00330 [Candidatus Bathyarchaeum tardum]WNZ30290.1 MAG: hypothetical protein IAX21_05455 [Candidatus Bathyarchaeota archaeon]
MRKVLRNKKGVSPVLSSLLLTVIAVAGMSIAVSATYIITDGLHNNMSERVIVEDVWFNSDQISVYVRNIGRIKIDVDAVYVNQIRQDFSPLDLEEGKHGWLHVSYSWSPETEYEIKVVTGRGTQVADYYVSSP